MRRNKTQQYKHEWYLKNREKRIAQVLANTERKKPESGKIIYKVWSKKEQKVVYVGETTYDLATRITKHKNAAFRLMSNYPLHKAMRGDGWNNFRFDIVEYKPNDIWSEEYYVNFFNTYSDGYNCSHNGK